MLEYPLNNLRESVNTFVETTLISDHIWNKTDAFPEKNIALQHIKRTALSRLEMMLSRYEDNAEEGTKYVQQKYQEAYEKLAVNNKILHAIPVKHRLRKDIYHYLLESAAGQTKDFASSACGKPIMASALVDLVITDATFEAIEYIGQTLNIELKHPGVSWRR